MTSTNLFHALKLDDSYTLYSPGTGAAQKAALMSAYKRKQNVVFYYWSPTPLVGAMDLVKLDMPPYDAEKHVPDVAQVRQTRAQRLSRQSRLHRRERQVRGAGAHADRVPVQGVGAAAGHE